MGLDSGELVMDFEKTFDLEISDQQAASMQTPRHVRDFVVAEYERLGRAADPNTIFETIRDLTIAITNAKPAEVTLDTRSVDDLGLD